MATLGNYVYQVVGGRALGPVEFRPVVALLTLSFLAFAVVLLPIEQLVIRSVTWRGGFDRSPRSTVWVATTLTVAVTSAVALLGSEEFFEGEMGFVVLVGASVLTHAVYVVGRGNLAGTRKFRSYGVATAGMPVARLAVALVVLAAGTGALGFGTALAMAPLIIFLWWKLIRAARPERAESEESPGLFLVSFVLAAAASQVLLLAGPLAAALLGAAAAEISIVYVTLTIARSPLLLGYSLLVRVLPPFTNLARLGFDAELNRWTFRIAAAGLTLVVPAAIVGAWIGPDLVAVLFGEGFRPSSTFSALAAAGVCLGGAAMFLGQVLVARGDTGRLAVSWIAALTTAGVTLAATSGDVATRIGVAFLAGEFVAMVATGGLALRSPVFARQPLS